MKKLISILLTLVFVVGCVPFFPVAFAEEDGDIMASLSDIQRNSVGILNYLAYLTKEIESQKNNRLYMEDAYSSLFNNTYMNAIDEVTLGQLKSLMSTLYSFKMIATKRERIEYYFEQDQANAIYDAIPKPLDVTNIILSNNLKESLIAVVHMAIDSVYSYYDSIAESNLEYLQEGWELADDEMEILHSGHLDTIEYAWEIIHDYDLPGDLAINEDDINRFVAWKSNANLVGRIQFLESNQSVYQAFGEYWLVLAESYYEHGDMLKCLEAVKSYEIYSTRIFRKDYHYAKVLPLAIIAAGAVLQEKQYIDEAVRFTSLIIDNCNQEDWVLRYFAAITYIELAKKTSDDTYLRKAYDIVLDNVNMLVQEQITNNNTYLSEIKLEAIPAGTTEAKKKEIEAYNKGLQEVRKTAVPPASDALIINCDLLFSLADELNIDGNEKEKISGILFGHGDVLFLNPFINDLFVFDNKSNISADQVEISFDGKEMKIPAMYLSDGTTVSVGGLDSKTGKIFKIDDWAIKAVERKTASDISTFIATFTSKTAANFDYAEGSTVWINLNPTGDKHTDDLQISFQVVSKTDFLVPYLIFQRIK